MSVGISPNCGKECAGRNKRTREKYRRTCNERFGCDNAFQSDFVKEKSRERMVERYGVEYTTHSDELRWKCRKTCLEHFGVDHQWKSDEIKRKNKETMLGRYGVDNTIANGVFNGKLVVTRRINRYKTLLENKSVVPNFTLGEFIQPCEIDMIVPGKRIGVEFGGLYFH